MPWVLVALGVRQGLELDRAVTAHSILAPSSAARRVQCPGSVRLEAANPETEDSPASADGTAVHFAASEMLAGREPEISTAAPNGVFLTREMLEAADVYVEYIRRVLTPFGMVPEDGAIEVSLNIPQVHALSHGTPDYRAWLPTTPRRTLFVADLKYGHGVVEAFENWQLMEYASGATSHWLLDDLTTDVLLAVVQPRAFHREGPVREWRLPASDLRGYINRSRAAAVEALGPDPTFRTGEECLHCRGRHACTTLQRVGFRGMDEAGKRQPFDLPPAAMGLEIRMLGDAIKRLTARHSGLEEQALAQIKRGIQIPGLAIEQGVGRKQWKLPDAQVLSLGAMMGVDLAKPAAPITPTQAEAKGFPLDAMPELIETPRTGATLVIDDGARARRVFG